MSSKIGHSFTVSEVDFTKSLDTYLNIQKRRDTVFFAPTSDAINVNLSYIESQDISSDKNLTIVDRSASLPQNRVIAQVEDLILLDVPGFTIETDLFLVTDQFTIDLNTQQRVPLFYSHRLSTTLNTGEIYSDIRLLDGEYKDIHSSAYTVSSGVIYSNYQNEFDPSTGLSDLFFVTYVIKKSDNTIERYTEILNNAPVFHEATAADIDPDTGFILNGVKAYIIEEDIGGIFNVVLPVSTDYGLRRNETSRIVIQPPPLTPNADPWFVSIKNGKFLAPGVTGINKYHIAEFDNQFFVPFFPYKFTDETSYRVSNRIIKTLRNQIIISEDESLFPEVIVYSKDNIPKFAFTADPSKIGTSALDTGIRFSHARLGISRSAGLGLNNEDRSINESSIDSNNGFIVLPAGFEILETDIVRTRYTYIELNYEVTLFNFNLLESAEFLDERVVLFIRPEPLGSTLTKTLYYLIVNEDGLVIDHDIDFTLSGVNSTASGLLWYDRDPSTVFWANPSGMDFVEHCSVEGSDNQDDILILGDVFVREALAPNELVLNDIRTRGGGISTNSIVSAVRINPEAEWFWDLGIWDGKPFQGAGAFFVDVPVEILNTVSGVLTPSNIREIVNRHAALGTYPVIHGYNTYQPTVTGINYLASGVIELSWTPALTDQVFDIFVGDGVSEEFSLYLSGITDTTITIASGFNNSYVVLGRRSSDTVDIIDGSIFDVKLIEVE